MSHFDLLIALRWLIIKSLTELNNLSCVQCYSWIPRGCLQYIWSRYSNKTYLNAYISTRETLLHLEVHRQAPQSVATATAQPCMVVCHLGLAQFSPLQPQLAREDACWSGGISKLHNKGARYQDVWGSRPVAAGPSTSGGGGVGQHFTDMRSHFSLSTLVNWPARKLNICLGAAPPAAKGGAK